MRRLIPYFIFITIITAGWLVWSILGRTNDRAVSSQLVAGEQDTSGFARATAVRDFEFPADHGPHLDYLTEWWYFTGNLDTVDGSHFGYELTFFRRALTAEQISSDRQSNWATNQVFFAHFSITDVQGRNFEAFERFSRGAADLAGAQGSPWFRVWLEDWEVEQTASTTYQLFAEQDGFMLSLELKDTKGPILQGLDGISPKGPERGNASYYYTLSNLVSKGTVEIDGRTYEVSGKSWMDHEFSTSALSADQIGWDWFSIQLEDNTEIMYFQIRQEDGRSAPTSSGILIESDGSTRPLALDEVNLQVTGSWESDFSGAVYPSGWILSIPQIDLILEIEPFLKDQELDVSIIYWEGAVEISGTRAGKPVNGAGYVELTGYLESTAGRF